MNFESLRKAAWAVFRVGQLLTMFSVVAFVLASFVGPGPFHLYLLEAVGVGSTYVVLQTLAELMKRIGDPPEELVDLVPYLDRGVIALLVGFCYDMITWYRSYHGLEGSWGNLSLAHFILPEFFGMGALIFAFLLHLLSRYLLERYDLQERLDELEAEKNLVV